MDYIGVKRVDESGEVVGELRLIGLFTSKAYAESARPDPARPPEARVDHAMGRPDHRLARLQGGRRALRQLSEGRALRGRRIRSCARRSWRSSGCRRSATCGSSFAATRCGERWRRSSRFPATTCQRSCASGSSTCSSSVRRPGSDYTLSFATDPARFHFTIHIAAGDIPDRRWPSSSARWPTPPGLGRLALGRAVERARRGAATSSPAATPHVPRLLQVGFGDLPGHVRRPAVRAPWRRPAVRGRAPERAGHRRAADPAQALQDGREGAADRPPAAARAGSA